MVNCNLSEEEIKKINKLIRFSAGTLIGIGFSAGMLIGGMVVWLIMFNLKC